MIFVSPWVLLALPALPLLWWLLRVTPPAPRREVFPAIRLLLGLRATEETSSRTPLWLLLLRMAAAGLVIVALARPVLDSGGRLPGEGPLLLVIDDGWSAAADWSARLQAADTVVDRADRAERLVALLTTSRSEDASPPAITPLMPVADLRARLAALRPKPWPVDRAEAAQALRGWRPQNAAVAYISDGIAAPGDAAFAAALSALGPVSETRADPPRTRLLLPPAVEADRLVVRVAQPASLGAPLVAPLGTAPEAAVLAQTGDGRTLARLDLPFVAGKTVAEADIRLPPELRNRLARLVIEGPASAGSVVLLDERWRRRPVGLLAGDSAAAESPLIGTLYYLRRALEPFSELRETDLASLLSRDISVLILSDRVVTDGAERDALTKWVDKGGLLIRFAGPATAAHPDGLLPVKLLDGDRQLGGALSWSQPASLAPFPPNSPFAGLTVPAEVRVTRQVLAEPSADLAAHSWASLTDGTPLVTEATRGAGRIVLFHVTGNADWSNLPLTGLFVDMLRRLVALSVGVAGGDPRAVLAPVSTLDGFGELVTPSGAATGLPGAAFGETAVSARHPPGFYGPESGRRALNLATKLPPLQVAAPIPGAQFQRLGEIAAERAFGPPLLALAVVLFAIDLLISLRLRGLLRLAGASALALALMVLPLAAHAEDDPLAARYPALATKLAYVITGDDQVDSVSRAGLTGLSDYVNRRTAATLASPVAVTPGQDDLSFYPLIYWPVLADASAPSDAAVASLNDYMGHGGIVLIDTREAGSGEDFSPGSAAALARIGRGLAVPPLAPLTTDHVLARSFYLLQDFPGRYTGDTVWVQRDQDRANDSVSPVIIGGNDWAAAWAVDASGRNPYAVMPGGARQRVMAYRFGVNLVMYALTGNYKGDQVHVPAILERLGQ
jgi:hypothetical protein